MATIKSGNVPGHWHMTAGSTAYGCVQTEKNGQPMPPEETPQCRDFSQALKRELESMQAIPADRLWSFPVPGGHAYYYIQSEDPLVITPIRYGDCHQIHNGEAEKLENEDLQGYRLNREYWRRLQEEAPPA